MTDQTSGETLAGRLFEAGIGMLDLLNIYLGQRAGFYDALKDSNAGLTPTELAQAAGAHVRYAREWLEQQGTTGLLEVASDSEDPDSRRFRLTPASKEVLTEKTSLNYLMPMAEMFGSLGQHTAKLLDAYRTGGGVSWGEFGHEMREAQAAFNRPMFLNLLATEYLPSVADVHEKLSSGNGRVADIACGGGWSSIGIAKGYPNATVDGFDIDEPSVELARANAQAEGVADRVTFHNMDAAEADGTYDLVMICEALHDMPQPVPVLSAARKLAGENGTVIVMDEAVGEKFQPQSDEIERFMYGISTWVCLPDSMSHQPSVATGTVIRPGTLRKYAQEAGFADIEALPIENDFFRFYRLK